MGYGIMTRKMKEKKYIKPPATIPMLSDIRMEMKYYRGNIRGLLICGCVGFAAYSHTQIVVCIGKEQVSVNGDDLWCRSFGNRVAEIIGEIKEIHFSGAQHD